MKPTVLLLMVFLLLPLSNAVATPCNGDFTCDGDVDSDDVTEFLNHFGRSQYNNPCDPCFAGAPVPKTGQTTMYSNGDDGHLQKGVAPPNPRFTDNEDGTVTDNLTGLIWLKDASCYGYKTWVHALNLCYYQAADGECGLTDGSSQGDWRLPNFRELFSLVDAESYSSVLPSGHPFTGVIPYFWYWSSTTHGRHDHQAWTMSTELGIMVILDKTDENRFWCARGGH